MDEPDQEDWDGRLNSTDWGSLRTAYGPAEDVPGLLRELRFGAGDAPLKAANRLWASLCHQHAYVSSAALPALPFLVEVLASPSSGALAEELLDIVLGFARCTGPDYGDPPDWARELRSQTKAVAELLAWWSTNGTAEERELASEALDAVASESQTAQPPARRSAVVAEGRSEPRRGQRPAAAPGGARGRAG